jgi:hypothetical protein
LGLVWPEPPPALADPMPEFIHLHFDAIAEKIVRSHEKQ